MDQFGVFTESYGLKPQGKSAPMAASKRQGSSINEAKSTPRNSSSLNGSDTMTQNYGGAGDGYDVFFGNLSDQRTNKSSFDYDSFFGGSNDFGAKSSQFSGYNDNDDIFGGLNSSASAKLSDDVFGSFGSIKGSSRDGGDLLGNFGDQPKASNPNAFDAAGLYDWSDGFGANMQTNQPRQPADSTFMKSEDPFAVLESTSNTAYSSPDLFSAPLQENTHFNIGGVTKPNVSSNASLKLRPPPKPSQVVKPDQVKSSYASEIDELEDFAMGGPGNNYNKEKLKIPTVSKKASNLGMGIRERQNAKPSRDKVADDAAMKNQQKGEGDLESFFSMSTRSSSAPKSRNTTSVPNKKEPEGAESTFSGSSSSIKRASSETNLVDDLSSVFGASPMFGEFEEVDGESEERRRARMGRLKRTEERAAKALADMTQRDLQTQREQNERCRIAEIVDFDVKRWAAGKENNMRALLSSLHQVLWPECGWQPVSLTDMIASTSVKKVYRKATLCIHPDKVQQKGATLQQKYTAEKVFDILKEAWNKFNKEELS